MSKQSKAKEETAVECYTFAPEAGGYRVTKVRAVIVEEVQDYGPDFLPVCTEWVGRKVVEGV
jgi:hypothetical protein